jgi:glutamate synthase domain-containing protein 2
VRAHRYRGALAAVAIQQVSPGEFGADAGIAKKLDRLEIKTFRGVTVTEQRA